MKGKNVHYAQDLIQEIPMFSGKIIYNDNDNNNDDQNDTTTENYDQVHDLYNSQITNDNDHNNDTNDNSTETSQSDLLHKMNLMAFSNGWNDKNEQIIISIGENAASYKWMHEHSASECSMINATLNILTIILTTGLSAEITLFNNNADYTVTILKQFIIYTVNVLTIVQNFLRYEELSQKYLTAANDFGELYHDIQQQMCMYRRDRIQATLYVSECLKKYDSYIVRSPEIGSRIMNKFKTTFKDTTLPDITDKIQKIEIITEPSLFKRRQHQKKSKNIQMQEQEQQQPPQQQQIYTKRNSNLSQIHTAFKIQGDITDEELKSINPNELKQLKQLFLDKKSDYEYQRFLNGAMDSAHPTGM